MRIGVNALYLISAGVGGTEIYLQNLLAALAEIDQENEYFVFTDRHAPATLIPGAGNFRHIPQPVDARNRPARLIYEQTRLPAALRRQGIDCLLNAGFTAPAFSPCPNVTVFHDLQHKRHPEYFRWFDRPAWSFFLGLAIRSSRLLIADSEATADDLRRFYGLRDERIRVVPLGVEPQLFGLHRAPSLLPFLLCVSTLHPHKNLERLVRVFARFRAAHPDWRLVLAGLRGHHATAVENAIAASDCAEAIRVTGWIPREELLELYSTAAAAVYPSTFEGFGLPVVEAMAAGLPLACSKIEPLLSITDGTVATFDPTDDDAMLRALEFIASPVYDTTPAMERARAFTWRRTAALTLAAVQEVVNR